MLNKVWWTQVLMGIPGGVIPKVTHSPISGTDHTFMALRNQSIQTMLLDAEVTQET